MKTKSGIIIDRDLIHKYSLRGPRYTSYPTAPEWKPEVGEEQYWNHIRESNQDGSVRPISLYFHIPFCRERCYYCACNVIITKHETISDQYVEFLTHEMELVAKEISPNRKVNQFHLGGGTPTHLQPASLARLFTNTSQLFAFEENAERSIEVDLRVTQEEHLTVLREYHFNRISTGVQDFSWDTQVAINREQSTEDTYNFVQLCRKYGFESFNIDLVYGLPHQTLETFDRTIDALIQISPDRIALYNYAHLPDRLPYQRRIRDEWLPGAEERFLIFQLAVERLTESGYVYIGLDHFAKPEDELTRAMQEGSLQRNFMGFTTRAGSDLYGFGTSSISSLQTIYVQNLKSLRQYRNLVEADHLPIERGIELSLDDRIRRWTIMNLMCNLYISASDFKKVWNLDFAEYFAEELPRLKPFVDDGLLNSNVEEELKVTPLGQMIVRPIAMVFDAYLTRARKIGAQTPVYSKTL
ncbi:MAG: oxygen-independent coproporphyrinogen III oxidase [bacterium]|jgi:oxygen-independent coproporphyrinogen-3 oxidase